MPATTQERHLLSLTTPLGDNVLVLSSFTGQEAMSRLFSYQLQMWSENEDILPEDIVGQNVTWAVTPHSQGSAKDARHFNGYVSRFAAGGHDPRKVRTYRMEVVPWLWFLTRTANCRMFQNKTVKDIIKAIFDDAGFTDYKMDGIKGKHPTREYCVQYRETAFNFVSRLMEQEGIFYFFRHEEGKHTLILADQVGAYYDCKESPVIYRAGSAVGNRIDSWEHHYEFRSGKWVQTDYNFETPKTSLLSEPALTVAPLPDAENYELFDYPGEYSVPADGKQLTELRMGEEEQSYDTVYASSECRTFSPGGKFTVKDHEIESEKGKSYVITSVQHMATETGHEESTEPSEYHNSFTCIAATRVFHPTRLTPKPFVQGPQPAVVVGPKGQEIYTDKYGRIKVQFFWDREGKRDENSSCWIRVAQVWAGKRWGASFWPRIGQEVIVGFLEGDPDRPLVIGSVYNADQMPPYLSDGKDPGPDDKHKNDNKVSGIKSNTTPGGKGFNELRFDDTQGKEQVFIHGERNMDVRVKNDSLERIFGNRHQVIGWQKDGQKGGDQREMVYQDKHLDIKRNQVEHIEGNLQLTVGHGEADAGGNVDIVIEKDKKELIEQNSHLHVKADLKEKIDGNQSLTVGGNLQEQVTGDHALSAQTIYVKAGMTLVLEAGMQLSLKVGGNFIDIGPAGISIQGTMVMINSGGAAGSGSGPSPDAPDDAQQAQPTKPDLADDAKTGVKSAPN
jgi:type VI secretion system secreted protein VgrG